MSAYRNELPATSDDSNGSLPIQISHHLTYPMYKNYNDTYENIFSTYTVCEYFDSLSDVEIRSQEDDSLSEIDIFYQENRSSDSLKFSPKRKNGFYGKISKLHDSIMSNSDSSMCDTDEYNIYAANDVESTKIEAKSRQARICSNKIKYFESEKVPLHKERCEVIRKRPLAHERKNFSFGFRSYDASVFHKLIGGYLGYVDTHCHLDFLFKREGFKGSFKTYQANHSDDFPSCYEGCIAIFCDPLTFENKYQWEKLLKEDGVWAAFGCHPHNVKDFDSVTEKMLKEALKHPHVVALGEIGLDYSSRNFCDHKIQQKIFRTQLKIAVEMNLPIVIHCREAHDDCIRILKEEVPLNYYIHRHCFNGKWEEAEIWLNTFPNLYLGITGLVTFSSAKEVHEVARKVPLNRLLLETDAPYFVPRHKTLKDRKFSNPGMALHVAAQIAALRPETTLKEILHKVRGNTYRLYGC